MNNATQKDKIEQIEDLSGTSIRESIELIRISWGPQSMSSRTTLSRFKVATLNQVAFLCGIRIPGPKSERIEAIVQHLKIVRRLPSKISILAIDVGIKNLSHCRADIVDSESNVHRTEVKSWDTWDLHERYGEQYEPVLGDEGSLIEQKRYISHLSYCLARELVVDVRRRPDVIVVETQRTRSNNSAITLPNVMLNHTFENMFYANHYTLEKFKKGSKSGSLVIPMTSNGMANFWLNRFITKASLSKNSKKLRAELLFHWLGDTAISPFRIDGLALPENFTGLSHSQKSASFVKAYNPNLRKVDDMVDSMLYNLTAKTQLVNLKELSLSLQEVNPDLDGLVHSWNLRQMSNLYDLIRDLDLEVNNDFKQYIS